MFYFFLLFLLLGGTMVFYRLSPYYAALGLVTSSLFGSLILGCCGLPFLALLLLLIYVGGMLVVFIYSSALSADRYPTIRNFDEVILLFLLMSLWIFFIFEDYLGLCVKGGVVGSQDLMSLSMLYDFGGFYLIIRGLALLVVLVVSLVISFRFSVGSLRALWVDL